MLGIIVFIILIISLVLIISYTTDKGQWSEWVLQSEEGCVKKYVRECTMGSIAKALGKKCLQQTESKEDSSNCETKTDETKTETETQPVVEIENTNVQGRYVWIERVQNSTGTDKDDNALNIAEVVVTGVDGTDLTGVPGVKAIAGSVYERDAFPASNLIDRNESNFAHTDVISDFSKLFFMIDLGSDKFIKSIEIKNRKDCCQIRINGLQVRIQNSEGVDTYISPAITGATSTTLSILMDNLIKK